MAGRSDVSHCGRPQTQSRNSLWVLLLDVSLPVNPRGSWASAAGRVRRTGRLRFVVNSLLLALVLFFQLEPGPFCDVKSEPGTLL